jgi:hypothetical protein
MEFVTSQRDVSKNPGNGIGKHNEDNKRGSLVLNSAHEWSYHAGLSGQWYAQGQCYCDFRQLEPVRG